MRTWILQRTKSENARLLFKFFIVLFFIVINSSEAQWVNNPAQNTKLVFDAHDPVNISTAADNKGGAFLFWEDNKPSFQNDIYFVHVDGNGKASFRADGKKIVQLSGEKRNPISAVNQPNTAIVVWKDFTLHAKGELYAQKVLNNGNLLWSDNGLQLTNSSNEISDYSIDSDKNGNVFVSYLSKGEPLNSDYEICIQKVSATGKLLFDSSNVTFHKSKKRKHSTTVAADYQGGAYVFWIETDGNKSTIFSQKIDSTGKPVWIKNAVAVSGSENPIITYSSHITGDGSAYIVWQAQKSGKEIFHQLINAQGKVQWKTGDMTASTGIGNKTNPQAFVSDSTIVLSWTKETEKNRDIFIQKYSLYGKKLWGESAVNVINFAGDQFGQKLISDGRGGAIVAWIDKRNEGMRGNIYAQLIKNNGKQSWDSAGVPAGSNPNSEKSYLSILSDGRGGAIIIFKDKRDGAGEIFGQKIFNTGTYISQIIGFTAEHETDSIKISWYSANETGETIYEIERTLQSDSASTNWDVISTIYSDGSSSANYFEYKDKPEVNGTIYYRIAQKDSEGSIQLSDVSRVNFFESSEQITVAQNIPNPFSENTTIHFFLPHSSKVLIEFFNSRVEKISWREEVFPAGENEVPFSAEGLNPGIYFYRIEIGEHVEVKKMIVTK
jgi:hypothetical protein